MQRMLMPIISYTFNCNVMSKGSRLGLLRLLGPELHQNVYKTVHAKDKDNGDPRISPAKVLFLDVQRAKVVGAGGVLAHLTACSSVRVEEVCGTAHTTLVGLEVLCASLAGGWVEQRDFAGAALHFLIPCSEHHD